MCAGGARVHLQALGPLPGVPGGAARTSRRSATWRPLQAGTHSRQALTDIAPVFMHSSLRLASAAFPPLDTP